MPEAVKIDNRPDFVPKVFVSYSWSGKSRAKELADYLISECRVDVVIDIYHLKPGQNKYSFMQRIVDDDTIDRVLILCDRAYADKANNFEGGVGDEATIISPKIYQDANQTKFLPVVMEKDENGKPYVPTFADGRIYFDLSNAESYSRELKRLVRELYNLPADRKPALGNRPKWLDFPDVDTTGIENRVSIMSQLARKNADANSVLVDSTTELVRLVNGLSGLVNTGYDLPGMIAQTEPIRNTFVDLIAAYLQQANPSGEQIAVMFERMNNGVLPRDDRNSQFSHELEETVRYLLWDMFLCATATILYFEKFACLKEFLFRTYFVRKMLATSNDLEPVGFSYFRPYLSRLEDFYRNQISEQRPYTLAGRILTKRLYSPYISIASLVNADIMLAHLSVSMTADWNAWYPKLAPYWHHAGRDILWSKAISNSFCKKLLPLFDARGIHELKYGFEQMDKAWHTSGMSREGAAFGGIPSPSYLIPLDKIATLP